jgi:hypothetical protein
VEKSFILKCTYMYSYHSRTVFLLAIFGMVSLWSLPATVFARTPEAARGRILLQVESLGEAWYVSPLTGDRLYLANGDAAYSLLRSAGLGITNANLQKIPIGLNEAFEEADTDGDGLSDKLEAAIGTNPSVVDTDEDSYSDGVEVRGGFNPRGSGVVNLSSAFAQSLRGRILLQVESRGEAWYVHPIDGKRYYMADGNAAYQIMRFLGLGTSDETLNSIPKSSVQVDCGADERCFVSTVQTGTHAKVVWTQTSTLDGLQFQGEKAFLYDPSANGTLRTGFQEVLLNYTLEGEGSEDTIAISRGLFNQLQDAPVACTNVDQGNLITLLKRWQAGNASFGVVQMTENQARLDGEYEEFASRCLVSLNPFDSN